MTNAQNWLDETYPIERRNNIKKIGHNNNELFAIFNKVPVDLTGKFINFRNFDNLTELNLPYRRIELESIASFPISLQILQLASNSFPPSTLEPFSHLINLIKLDIGTVDSKESDHNQWYGSLIYLKRMKNLNWLCLGSTDIDCGLEYLPKHKFENLGFSSDFPHSKCLKLRKILKLINYDLNQFNLDFYHEDYLNAQQLLHDFKLIVKKIKDISEIGSGYYWEIVDGLKKSEIDLMRSHKDLIELINNSENKITEIKNLQSQNNVLSSELINANKQIEEYKSSQTLALEWAKKNHLSIQDNRGLDIESLKNKLSIASKNEIALWRDIDLKTTEIKRLTDKIDKFTKHIENVNLEIKDLNDWKRINKSKLEDFEEIKVSLATKQNELLSKNSELNILYKELEVLKSKLKYTNYRLNFCLGINTIGRQTVGRLPIIGGLSTNVIDALQGIILGARSFSSNDTYLESGVWLIIILGYIGIIVSLIPLVKWFIKNKVFSILSVLNSYKEAAKPPYRLKKRKY